MGLLEEEVDVKAKFTNEKDVYEIFPDDGEEFVEKLERIDLLESMDITN